MARNHGANLFDGTYVSDRRTTNKGNCEKTAVKVERKKKILKSLKGFIDKTTLKSWRDGITGSIQFSAKIITQDEGENGNCTEVQNGDNSDGRAEINPHHETITKAKNVHNLESSSDSILTNHYGLTKAFPLQSKTDMVLCLEIEKCFDLRIPTVSLLSMRRLLHTNKTVSLLCPFILIKLNNQEVGRTPALKNTKNPVWFDEYFQIPVCDKCKELTLEVWEELPPPKHIGQNYGGEQIVGDFIGSCSLSIQSILEQRLGGDELQAFSLQLHVSSNRFVNKIGRNRCSCPFQEQFEDAHIGGNLSDPLGKETVRIQPKGNPFKGKRLRLPSILVEKPGNKCKQNLKVKNPQPFRRKDIREMNIEEDEESFFSSTFVKSLILVGLYLIIGVIGFSFTFQKWSIRDSIYFSVVTFSTVGYGDIRPENSGAKLFTCIFTLMGIGIIGIALGFIGQNLVHAQVVALQRSQKKKEENGSESSALWNTIIFICPIAIMTLLGSIVVGSNEQWNWVDAIYWCIMTGTSVGYGDFVPRSNEMIWFSVVYIPLSVGCTSAALGKIANIFVEREIAKANTKLLKREVTLEDLEIMNADGDGEVSPLEFIEYMLKVMHKVDQNLLDELHSQFEKLDADGSGGLQQDDLVLLTERKLKERRQEALKRYKSNLLHPHVVLSKSRIRSPQIAPNG